jgi:cytochrome c peroxidase
VRLFLVSILAMMTASAVAADDTALREEANAIFNPLPHAPPTLAGNPFNTDKVELGKLLFFDPRLSSSGAISCSTCHDLAEGGADKLSKSIGHGGQEGRRNAPTVFNSVFNIALFWDGRARTLRQQARGPIESAVEMNNTPEALVATLKGIPAYVEKFSKAFPEQEEPLNYDNVTKALESFQSTLLTPDSPFDRFLRGEDKAMSELQLRGLRQFIGQGCVTCHRGTNVGGNAFFTFGMMIAPEVRVRPVNDHGRMEVSGRSLHDYTFRVASLRNVARTAPYFHSGIIWDLREAVRIMAKSQLNATLTDNDVEEIVAFLGSLSGTLPQVDQPTLPEATKATPKPVE